MRKIQFLKDPGYTYDIFFLFALYFNKQRWIPQITNHNKANEDNEYFEKVLDPFLPISEELLVFFYLNDDNMLFMTEKYYEPFTELFNSQKYNLSLVLTELSNYQQVTDNVIKFYFKDISDEKLAECRNSLPALNRLIKESHYTGDIKSALLSFLIEPVPVIQKLMQELMAKELIIAKQYNSRYKELIDVQNTFSYEELVTGMRNATNPPIEIGSYEEINISFCLHAKNAICTYFYDKSILLVLGTDYISTLEFYSDRSKIFDFEIFGNAMSERNRIDILNLIHGRKEVTIKEIENCLGLTPTNAYYHLAFMIRTGMLKTRNRGRTIIYSVNKDYFTELGNLLLKYGK